MIAFMGCLPLEGRLWVFKIPWDKPWEWPDIKFLGNPIEVQTHFSQEGNCHAMWYTTSRTNLNTKMFPRIAVLPYAVVEWISGRGENT